MILYKMMNIRGGVHVVEMSVAYWIANQQKDDEPSTKKD